MNFGPQVDVPVGFSEASNAIPNQAWQGLTIKEILEKVDLSNIIMDEDKKKVGISCPLCPSPLLKCLLSCPHQCHFVYAVYFVVIGHVAKKVWMLFLEIKVQIRIVI